MRKSLQRHFRFLTVLMLISFAISSSFSCGDRLRPLPARPDPKAEALTIPKGFIAETLFNASADSLGSWVAMTFDDKGRIIACDGGGYLYRVTVPAIGDSTKATAERLIIPNGTSSDSSDKRARFGYANGLLWAYNSLYVVVNRSTDTALNIHSGFYRVQDTDGDDQFDKLTLLQSFDGEGEHGPHSIVMGPDKQSLYIIAGNFTKIPPMQQADYLSYVKPDNILPLIKDPGGHDNVVNYQGGWIAKTDSIGSHWQLISSGFRNPFDLAFNDEGEMFTFDSDMEWDFGTPWYRPTRICHVTSGAEFGWRPGNTKWSPVYPDNLPPILNIGQGSPTNVLYAGDAAFPEKYRRSLFAFDWSFGRIYTIQLTPKGASYDTRAEIFLSADALPLTDGVIGPDGSLYFLTGGRGLESNLYRVYYEKEIRQGDRKPKELTEEQKLRKQLEKFHYEASQDAVEFAWPYLSHDDRLVRYAARIAMERQPLAQWKNRVLSEKQPVALTQAAIALARKGSAEDQQPLLSALCTINYISLSATQQTDLLRAFELVFSRMGHPAEEMRKSVIAYLDPHYPAKKNNELNRELVKVLAYLDAPSVVAKTIPLINEAKDDNSSGQESFFSSVDLVTRHKGYGTDIAQVLTKTPPSQQIFYANALMPVKNGWTKALREEYFQWFRKAFGYRGGVSYAGFINDARKEALKNVPAGERAYYYATSGGDSILEFSKKNMLGQGVEIKGPGRNWKLEEAVAVADSGISARDFTKGKGFFAATLCISCHQMNGEGGSVGPDLTRIGTRFTYRDMLEAIIDPGKVISDQYNYSVLHLKNGDSLTGRLLDQNEKMYVLSQNPFDHSQSREVDRADVVRVAKSATSPMLPGLINRLNAEELRDLLAYLKAGGNERDTIFK